MDTTMATATIVAAVITAIALIFAAWIQKQQPDKKPPARTKGVSPEPKGDKVFRFKIYVKNIIHVELVYVRIFLIVIMVAIIAIMANVLYTYEPTPPITPPPTPTPSVTPTPIPIIWQESDMGFTLEEQNHLAIGAGRGDDVMRVYSTTNEINEYTFSDNNWEKSSFGDLFAGFDKLIVGNVRNDGVNRIYATTSFALAEYYYEYPSNLWLGGEVSTDIYCARKWVLGNARNDGYVRIYVSDRDGTKEISYNYGDWDVVQITDMEWEPLVVTDGRNDGIPRVYLPAGKHVYEYSWSGSTWQVKDCGLFDVSEYNGFADICAGDGRNGGSNRIYLAGDDNGIYELSYDGQSWQHITVSDSVTVNHMVVANGRNDGVNRLYTGSSKGVGEYTYSESWAKTSLIETSFEVNGLAVGNGRNDGVNRVYVTGDDNHVYEYSLG